MRESQILAALAGHALNVGELAKRLYPDIVPALRAAAVQQTAAHLDYLKSRGLVVAEDGRFRI